MLGAVTDMDFFSKIPRMEAEKLPRRYFVLRVKCPSLLSDRKERYNIWRVSAATPMCGVSAKIPPTKA